MGLSKKDKIEEIGLETEGKKWVIVGIALRGPLKCITTKRDEEDEEKDERSTTPTATEARIPEGLHCPPAPRKRPQTASCHFNGVGEFFTPPDLESVFIRHVERAN